MQFRLVYEGVLLGQNSSAAHKWDIRRAFHPQLATLWNQEPLSFIKETALGEPTDSAKLSNLRKRGKVTLAPLVTFDLRLFVEVSVLLLRPRIPGCKPTDRSDTDNQLKTLIDALRVPSGAQRIESEIAATLPSPFYCLLEDDSLVTKVSLEAEQWLAPRESNQSLAIITIDIKKYYLTYGNGVF